VVAIAKNDIIFSDQHRRVGRIRRAILEHLPQDVRSLLHGCRAFLDPRARTEHKRALQTADALLEALTPLGETVAQGPFAGMTLPPRLVKWGRPAPYLIGSYEEELQEPLERLLAKAPSLVVNVGCAEGYYAIGIARRLPRARVVAVDPDPDARARCRQLAELNGVSTRIRLEPALIAEDLRGLLQLGTMIICDCEGCEIALLDPVVAPELEAADLIVELHDHVVPGSARSIIDRFVDTHRVSVLQSRKRMPDPAVYPSLRSLPPRYWSGLLDETRPGPMQWAVMEHA